AAPGYRYAGSYSASTAALSTHTAPSSTAASPPQRRAARSAMAALLAGESIRPRPARSVAPGPHMAAWLGGCGGSGLSVVDLPAPEWRRQAGEEASERATGHSTVLGAHVAAC